MTGLRRPGVWLLALLTVATVQAQTLGEVEERRSTARAYFVHVLPGERTITVSVWGTVPQPGTYDVGVGTTLGDVLSLAGGPLLPPLRQTSETTLVREVRVRLHRDAGGQRQVLVDRTVEETVASADASTVLQQGDVVEVVTLETETRRWTWRDSAALGGIATSAAVAILQIVTLIVR